MDDSGGLLISCVAATAENRRSALDVLHKTIIEEPVSVETIAVSDLAFQSQFLSHRVSRGDEVWLFWRTELLNELFCV